MATTPSVRIIKSFPYRGGTKEFSNRYHFNGGVPADTAHWINLFDAVTAYEKSLWTPFVTVTGAVGYEAGSEIPVASKSYSLAGTGSWTSQARAPGDSAILLRWATTARSSKNHPIYLYNYYHGVCTNATTTGDIPDSTQKGIIDTYAGIWISGMSDGTHTLVRAGPNGATATGHQVETYITHRDFPR